MKKSTRRTAKKIKRVFQWSLLGLVIVGVVYLAIMGAQSCGLVRTVPEIERSLPDNVDSLYAIQADTRLYYAEQCLETAGAVTMINFWTYEKKRWRFHEDTETLNREAYYKIEVKTP